MASCVLSTAIRGGGTIIQQIRSVHQIFTILSSHWSHMGMASCLLSNAIRGGGTVLQQMRSVHQLFIKLFSQWSSSRSRGWPCAFSPPRHQRRENYITADQDITSAVYNTVFSLISQSVTWVASCLLSTAIRGGGTVLHQIRSVHQLFTKLSSHWSGSLSRGWPHASSPPPSEAGEL